jgi:hypothetical protein
MTPMKSLKLHIGFCVALSLVTGVAAQTRTKTNERGYFGPVVNVRTETVAYSIEGGKPRRGKRKLDSIEHFDAAGRLLQEQNFTDEGAILYQYKYLYDSRGRHIETSGTHSKFTYLSDRIAYVYDSVGNLVTENGFDSQGKLVNTNNYAYDEKQRKIRWTSMSYHPEEHSNPHQWTYDYYENGRVKEERAFADEGSGFRPTDSLGAPHRKFFIYNSQNKPALVLLYNVNGAFAGLESTVYDSRENELEEIQYDSTGALKEKTKYSYRFDKFGNSAVQNTYEWDAKTGTYHLSEISYEFLEYRR